MLTSMREGAGAHIIKYVALGFVLLGTMGMVFMDVGGFFRSGGLSDTTLARVGGTKIDQAMFERTAQPALRAQNMTLQEAYRFGLLQNLLEEMATREASRQEAMEEGIVFSRDDMARQVHEAIRMQIQPGETAQEALNRILQAQGSSEAELVAALRQNQTVNVMVAPLRGATGFMPRLMSEALGRYQGERRDIVFFTLTPEGVAGDIKADEDALKTYYETVKDRYQIPEERTFKTIVLSADDVRDSVRITDADVKSAYDERKDQFRIGERRRIEQIVLPAAAEAKAATEAARKGKSLKSLAPAAYREPADIEQAGLPAELGAAVFGADKGTVLNPIQTPLGWHVIRVIAVTPARNQTFAEVKDNLRKELESDALHTEMEARIAKVDESLGSGASLEQTASDLNLAIRTVGPIDSAGNFQQGETQDSLLTSLGQNKDLLASLFELMEGETGDLAEISEGLHAAFSLENVRPTRDRDFAEVREQVEKKWLEEQRTEALNDRLEKLVGELSRGEKDFAQAAKESNAVLKTARDVSRKSKVAGLNDPIALSRLFDETDLKSVVKVPTESGVILARVLDARIPDAGQGKLSEGDEAQLRAQMEQAIMALFLADLREKHDVVINTEQLEKIYGAGADAE